MDPHDDETIEADDKIIRRINPRHHVVWDENLGRKRISSKAFSPSSAPNGGMSVDIAKLIEEDELDPHEYVTTPDFIGSVVFSAGDIRSIGLMVGSDPLPENPYHGEVWGSKQPNKFTASQKKRLRNVCNWFVPIPDVEIAP